MKLERMTEKKGGSYTSMNAPKISQPSLNETIAKGLPLSKVLPLIYAAVLQTLKNWAAACKQS